MLQEIVSKVQFVLYILCEKRKVNDRLFDCLITQDSQKFRKDWRRYYDCHNEATIIFDYPSNADIFEGFAILALKIILRLVMIACI